MTRCLPTTRFIGAPKRICAQREDAAALAELKQIRRDYPDSVITEQSLQSIAVAAAALNQPAEAVSALDAYPMTPQRPGLLLLRAEAHEKAGQPLEAALDYQAIYMRFALSEQAREAATKLDFLQSSRGRADSAASARSAHGPCGNPVQCQAVERCPLGICGAPATAFGSGPRARGTADSRMRRGAWRLPFGDDGSADHRPGCRRGTLVLPGRVLPIASAGSRKWWLPWRLRPRARLPAAGRPLRSSLAGNFYWVRLDRDRAASYYKRMADQFPAAPDAANAQWRVAWTAVLKRAPEGAELLQEHLRLFPGINLHSRRALLARPACGGRRSCRVSREVITIN